MLLKWIRVNLIEKKNYGDSILPEVNQLDNRPEQRRDPNRIKETQPDKNELAQRQIELNRYNESFNSIQPDDIHLSACMQWLVKAQEVNSGGGVSSVYFMDSQRWDVDYPEATGYIIPTFLAYFKLTGDDSYRKRAIDMGDWEIAIQFSEGGAGEPVGV